MSTATNISLVPKAKIIENDAAHDIPQKSIIDYLRVIHLVTRMQAKDARSSAEPEKIAYR